MLISRATASVSGQHSTMVLSVEPRSVLRSYTFFVCSLMFGLPLLISYYVVSEGIGDSALIIGGYIGASLLVGVFLLLKRGKGETALREPEPVRATGPDSPYRRYGPYLSLAFGTVAVASFGLMRYFILKTYPYPSASASWAGGLYVGALAVALALGVPLVVAWGFRPVRAALADRTLKVAAALLSLAYFVTYEILVNEILITGYNTSPGNIVQSPAGTYPFVYAFTGGPAPGNFIENAIYTPYVLLQASPGLNFIFQPFELALAVTISVLVGCTIVATYHTVRQSEVMGGACSASATLSGVGAFLGYTATCPSCLAPTLISVLFGGLSSVQLVYSNLWGAVIPPVVSVAALVFSLVMLAYAFRPRSSQG